MVAFGRRLRPEFPVDIALRRSCICFLIREKRLVLLSNHFIFRCCELHLNLVRGMDLLGLQSSLVFVAQMGLVCRGGRLAPALVMLLMRG